MLREDYFVHGYSNQQNSSGSIEGGI